MNISGEWQRVVAVEAAGENSAVIFRRSPDGSSVQREEYPFQPWILVAGRELGETVEGNCGVQELTGNGAFRAKVIFPDWKSCEEGAKKLKKFTGASPSSPLAPYRLFNDQTQQIMTTMGIRLFSGMEFTELRRMQLDIETRSSVPGKFCDALRPDDSVTLVSLKDSAGFEECISAADGGEAQLLREMIRLIQERDPDTIEGHNIFNFDLDYLEKRCKFHKIPFAIGRDGKVPKARASRIVIAEKTINYRRYDIFGRHVVDTWFLVQMADVSRRNMDSYGLKYSAKYFGIAREGRVYIPGDQLTEMFSKDPERLKEYCLDDVRETDGLSRIIAPSYFYQNQLLPLSYQNCLLRGNATRIDALLTGEYLAAGASLPTPSAAVPFEGALTEATRTGIYRPVWHIDVRSLYPSVILAEKLAPASDYLGVYLKWLEQLRRFRLEAKDAMRVAVEPAEKERLAALQSSFKILINAFYGYLGFAQGTFNDYAMAERVTASGRRILSGMKGHLEEAGAAVVEMDTDGIYFVPPADNGGVDEMRQYIQAQLPPGIEVELDGVYRGMFSYKSKNYALQEQSGRIILHGAALRSRGLEPFLRRFVEEAVKVALEGKSEELPEVSRRYAEQIAKHELPLTDFMKKENLTVSVESYKAALASGKGRRSAVYELAANATREYQSGDAVRYYVTGTKKSVQVASNSRLAEDADESRRDENIPYYLDKLESLSSKLQEALAGSEM